MCFQPLAGDPAMDSGALFERRFSGCFGIVSAKALTLFESKIPTQGQNRALKHPKVRSAPRPRVSIHKIDPRWCIVFVMSRTNIDIDENLIRKARKLTRLKTKRQIVDKALELLVRSESRKGILRYYGSGIWKGDLKSSRRNRA